MARYRVELQNGNTYEVEAGDNWDGTFSPQEYMQMINTPLLPSESSGPSLGGLLKGTGSAILSGAANLGEGLVATGKTIGDEIAGASDLAAQYAAEKFPKTYGALNRFARPVFEGLQSLAEPLQPIADPGTFRDVQETLDKPYQTEEPTWGSAAYNAVKGTTAFLPYLLTGPAAPLAMGTTEAAKTYQDELAKGTPTSDAAAESLLSGGQTAAGVGIYSKVAGKVALPFLRELPYVKDFAEQVAKQFAGLEASSVFNQIVDWIRKGMTPEEAINRFKSDLMTNAVSGPLMAIGAPRAGKGKVEPSGVEARLAEIMSESGGEPPPPSSPRALPPGESLPQAALPGPKEPLRLPPPEWVKPEVQYGETPEGYSARAEAISPALEAVSPQVPAPIEPRPILPERARALSTAFESVPPQSSRPAMEIPAIEPKVQETKPGADQIQRAIDERVAKAKYIIENNPVDERYLREYQGLKPFKKGGNDYPPEVWQRAWELADKNKILVEIPGNRDFKSEFASLRDYNAGAYARPKPVNFLRRDPLTESELAEAVSAIKSGTNAIERDQIKQAFISQKFPGEGPEVAQLQNGAEKAINRALLVKETLTPEEIAITARTNEYKDIAKSAASSLKQGLESAGYPTELKVGDRLKHPDLGKIEITNVDPGLKVVDYSVLKGRPGQERSVGRGINKPINELLVVAKRIPAKKAPAAAVAPSPLPPKVEASAPLAETVVFGKPASYNGKKRIQVTGLNKENNPVGDALVILQKRGRDGWILQSEGYEASDTGIPLKVETEILSNSSLAEVKKSAEEILKTGTSSAQKEMEGLRFKDFPVSRPTSSQWIAPMVARGDTGVFHGPAFGKPAWSQGHVLFVGKAPGPLSTKEQPDFSVVTSSVPGDFGKDIPIQPVAGYRDPQGSRLIAFNNGHVADARYVKYALDTYPGAKLYAQKPGDAFSPIIVTMDAKPVGIIMPAKHELPSNVKAIIEQDRSLAEAIGTPVPEMSKGDKASAPKRGKKSKLSSERGAWIGPGDVAETVSKVVDWFTDPYKTRKEFKEAKKTGTVSEIELSPQEALFRGETIWAFQARRAIPTARLKSAYEKGFVLPSTVARRDPASKVVYEVGREMIKESDSTTLDFATQLKDFFDLKDPAEQKKVDDYLAAARIASADGRVLDESTDALARRGFSPEGVKAIQSVRETMDSVFNLIEETRLADTERASSVMMKEVARKANEEASRKFPGDKEAQEDFVKSKLSDAYGSKMKLLAAVKTQLKNMRAEKYVPFSQKGEWYVHAKDEVGTRSFSLFENKLEAQKAANKLTSEGQTGIEVGRMPTPTTEALTGLPRDLMLKIAEMQPEAVGALLPSGMNSAGFTKHFLKANLVEGFKPNFREAIWDYISAASRFAAKRKADPKFEAAIEKLKSSNKTETANYWTDWWKYINTPSGEFSGLRALMFHMHLGGLTKSGLVNLTQTITTTYPVLSRYSKHPAADTVAAIKKANEYILSREKLAESNPELVKAIDMAIKEGVVSDQQLREMAGLARGKSPTLRTLSETSSWMQRQSELYNRIVAFSARFESARKAGEPFEKALKLAEDFVDETQFIYGKVNRPKIARGPVGATAMIFRLWTGNYLAILRRSLEEQDFKVAKRLLGTMLGLAGLAGMPFVKDFFNAAQNAGYDLRTDIRKTVQSHIGGQFGQILADALDYGIPALSGLNISGSVSTGEQFPGLEDSPAMALTKGLTGVAGDLPIRIGKAFNTARTGNLGRAAEYLLPTAIQSLSKAYRYATEGLRSPSGVQLIEPEEFSPLEIGAAGLGIQPTQVSKKYDAERASRLAAKTDQDLGKLFGSRLDVAISKGNQDEIQRIYSEAVRAGFKPRLIDHYLKVKEPEIYQHKQTPNRLKTRINEINKLYE